MTDTPDARKSAPPVHEPKEMPSVTCVIGAYNHAKYVTEALDSAFAQTYPNLRIIIYDDASTDGTPDVIRNWLAATAHDDVLFVAHEQNKGLCASLNEMLELIDSDYVAFISADDTQEPERIAVQAAALEDAGSDYGFAYADMTKMDDVGFPLEMTWFEWLNANGPATMRPKDGYIYHSLLQQYFLTAPTVMTRTRLLHTVGGWDEDLRFEDVDMALRLARITRAVYLPTPLVNYRVVAGSLGDTIYADPIHQAREHLMIFYKHVGDDRALNRVLARQIRKEAKRGYLAGEAPEAVTEHFLFALRHQPSASTLGYLVFSCLRIPGRWVGAAVSKGLSARSKLQTLLGRSTRNV